MVILPIGKGNPHVLAHFDVNRLFEQSILDARHDHRSAFDLHEHRLGVHAAGWHDL